jgi:hypothetical protein
MGVTYSVQASTIADTPGTQPGTSQAGSSSDQAGGCGGVSHVSQVGNNIREGTPNDTSGASSVCSQAMGSNVHHHHHSSSSSSSRVPPTGQDLFCRRPDMGRLLSLLDECVERIVRDPAVMGAAQQPAAWMPNKNLMMFSVVGCIVRVHRAVEDALSQGVLQRDML